MFNHAPAPKPPQEPAGALYPLSEAAARDLAQRAAADHVIRLHRARQPAPLPSYERRTDAEARALIEQGRRGIETIGKARQRLADKRVDAEAAIKTEETAIQTLQSVYSTGMELFVANTGARRPELIADELAERRARLDRARKVFIAAQADEVEAEQDFTDATDAANDLIRVGKHHLMLNSADKLADRLESAMTETINADAALRGLLDRAIREKNSDAVNFLNSCIESRRGRTPEQERIRREELKSKAAQLRADYARNSIQCGGET